MRQEADRVRELVFSGLAVNIAAIVCYFGKTGRSNRMPIMLFYVTNRIFSKKREKERKIDKTDRWGYRTSTLETSTRGLQHYPGNLLLVPRCPPQIPFPWAKNEMLELLPNTCFEILSCSKCLFTRLYQSTKAIKFWIRTSRRYLPSVTKKDCVMKPGEDRVTKSSSSQLSLG